MELKDQDFQNIAKFPLFNGICLTEIKNLLSLGKVSQHRHRGTLYEIGEQASSFSIVLNGAYKLVKPTIKGDDFIMYFATPGDAIGALLMSQDKNSTYPITVKSIGSSRVYLIPKMTFHNYWRTNAPILLKLNSLLYSRMGFLQDEKALSRAPLIQRVSWFLLKMLERKGEENDQTIPLPLTRQEIADHLGVTVESVIRIMSQWSQDGIIKSADRQIEISQIDKLIEIIKDN